MKTHTLTRGAALAGALTIAHASTALAAGGENTPLHLSGTTTVHSASSSGGIVRLIVGLFIVVVVIYGVAWVLRQVRGHRTQASAGALSELASLPLGGGRSLALVRAGQEVLLVGVAEHSVTPIRTYTEEEAADLGLAPELDSDHAADPGKTGSIGSFARRNSRAGQGRTSRDKSGGRHSQGGQGRFADTLRRLTVRS